MVITFIPAARAHRDWETLLAALGQARLPALISAGQPLSAPPNVTVLGQLSPEEGRACMRAARCVALTFIDTELPSGPLVLLDAMAHGKALVVSDVGGTRDYVEDRREALVVPPGDVNACAGAIRTLWNDPVLRRELGAAARARAATYTAEGFWRCVLLEAP